MTRTLFQVDAFTDRPFGGNPAAVCLLPAWPGDDWMQALARETNLSDTAFCVGRDDREFDLRWFTPRAEVDLCGHATLATAHVLWEERVIPLTRAARFHTRSGVLPATRSDGWIALSLPAAVPRSVTPPPDLLPSLGVEDPVDVAKAGADFLVVLSAESEVRQLQPDSTRLARIETRGVAVTAPGDRADVDFVSRFFAPAFGIDEDPVTGSAHCALGPYWAARLSKARLLAYQASARGGWVRVTVEGDRVGVAGQAVTVFKSELRA